METKAEGKIIKDVSYEFVGKEGENVSVRRAVILTDKNELYTVSFVPELALKVKQFEGLNGLMEFEIRVGKKQEPKVYLTAFDPYIQRKED